MSLTESIMKNVNHVVDCFVNKGLNIGFDDAKGICMKIYNNETKAIDENLIKKTASVALKAIALFVAGWVML